MTRSILLSLAWSSVALAQDWPSTLDRIAPAVVSIQIDRVRPFDTEFYANSQATGFVVDAEQGLILTNRHVVSPGPVVAEALFGNGEAVPLEAVYRDPVHDFGLFRYDPEALRFVDPPSLVLHPDGARVGTDIRVVGNDAGEKLSILAGTLARVDRPAPNYGRGDYNDFNTFYLQAASSTSGGSSGSPVLDVQGRVVALNAGSSTRAASSFYLPLDRVVRAVSRIREGQDVPRGTLLTTFQPRTWEELDRLGLDDATEAAARADFPGATGLLVATAPLPGSPAEAALSDGDVLVAIDGRPVAGFAALEAVLDARVGQDVVLTIDRNGTAREVTLPVTDLHAVTPDRFLELGDGVVHDLSYQQARSYNLPLRGVYVADSGYVLDRGGVPYHGVIVGVGDRPTPDLDAFVDAIQALPRDARVPFAYHDLGSPEQIELGVVEIDWDWFDARMCRRAVGPWDCEDVAPPVARAEAPGGTAVFPEATGKQAKRLRGAFALIDFDVPYKIEGTRTENYVGVATVVDAARGLVVTDRNTVPITLGDARLTFANQVTVPAEVVGVHPFHNLSLLRYDPALLGDTEVTAVPLHDAPVAPGDALHFVGLRTDGRPVDRAVQVEDVRPLRLPIPGRPRFVEHNTPVIYANAPDRSGGVLVDKRGRAVGLYGTFAYDGSRGVSEVSASQPVAAVLDLLARAPTGDPFPTLDVELDHVTLAEARELGLDEAWVRRLAAADDQAHVLQLDRRAEDGPLGALRGGELLLSARRDGGEEVLLTRLRDLERVALEGGPFTLTFARPGQPGVETTAVSPRPASPLGETEVILFAGTLVQAVPDAAAWQRSMPREGAYVDLRFRGGPAMRHGLLRNSRILAVDGRPTPDLAAFAEAVAALEDRAVVRLDTVDIDGRPRRVALRLDLTYFPTIALERRDGRWARRALRPE